jgi:predicted transcriptional regulator of viral defense system
MVYEELYKELEKKKLSIFSVREAEMLFPAEKKESIAVYLSRWQKAGKLGRLRKGIYELVYPVKKDIPDMYAANRLYGPSYVSMETALSRYGLISEAAMACVSVTPKTTREYKNSFGLFLYHTVRQKAFTGYRLEKNGAYDILIADPEKAFADFIYFKKRDGKTVDLTEERFDLKLLKKLDRKKLEHYFSVFNMEYGEFKDDHA